MLAVAVIVQGWSCLMEQVISYLYYMHKSCRELWMTTHKVNKTEHETLFQEETELISVVLWLWPVWDETWDV